MKIKFKKLRLINFMSFEDSEINLNDLGYTLITGINENLDDLAKSNGTGKSACADAINWCLTGETIRGTKDVVRFGSSGGCQVILECLIDNKSFEITRSKDPSNLKIIIDGNDKSGKGIRDTQKLLEEYLPDLTPSLIGSVIILGQGLPQRFSNNTPSGRKDVLEKLSKSDFMIQDIKERLLSRKEAISSDIRGKEDSILKLSTNKELLIKELSDNKLKLEMMSDDIYKSIIEEISSKIVSEKDILNDTLGRIDTLSSDEKNASEKLSTELKNYTDKKLAINESFSLEIEPIGSNIIKLSSEEESLSKKIAELKSIKDVCPTCGQKLPGVKVVDTSDLEIKLADLREEISNLNNELSLKKSAQNDALNDLKINFEKISNELTSNKNIISIELGKLLGEKTHLERNINSLEVDLAREETNLKNLNTNKENLEKSIQEAEAKVNEIEKNLLYINNELVELKDRLDINSRMFNLITRDFRGYLLTNVISFINNRTKEYSKELFNTDNVNFILDGNNIDIYYDNKPYECLSGGERQKMDIIIQLSLRDMLCTHLDFSSNILILDEISDNLDSVGAEKLFNLISTKLKDVESIFIISHHVDYSLPVDNTITIVKGNDKISRIV